MKRIFRGDLAQMLERGGEVVLVEALPRKYWLTAHLPGAIQMDHGEVRVKAPCDLPEKGARIVVYCAGKECQNSSKAALILETLGYSDVYEYEEGKEDWVQAGLPVVTEGA